MKNLREFLQVGAVGLGVDVGKGTIKAVELHRSVRGVELRAFGIVPTPEGAVEGGAILDRLDVGRALAALLHTSAIRTRKAVVGIAGQNVLARVLRLPPIPADEIKQAIRWEAEQYLPLPIDEAVLDVQMVREVATNGQRQIEVLLAAAPEALVLAHIETMERAGVRVEAVEVGALAMARALRTKAAATQALVNIGSSASDVAIVHEGIPQFTRTMQTSDDLDELTARLRRSLDFYRTQFADAVEELVLCGGGSAIPEIGEHLAGEFGVPVSIGNPFAEIMVGERLGPTTYPVAPQLTVAAGLALRMLG